MAVLPEDFEREFRLYGLKASSKLLLALISRCVGGAVCFRHNNSHCKERETSGLQEKAARERNIGRA